MCHCHPCPAGCLCSSTGYATTRQEQDHFGGREQRDRTDWHIVQYFIEVILGGGELRDHADWPTVQYCITA